MTIATTSPEEGRASRPISRRDFAALVAAAAAGLVGGLVSSSALATEPGPTAETAAALSNAQAEYEQATEELDRLGQEAEMAQYTLSQTQAQLDQTNADIASLQAQIDEKQAELEAKQDELASIVRSNYKAGPASALDVILGATDFNDFASRIDYEGKVSDDNLRVQNEVIQMKADLEQQRSDLQAKQAEQEQLVAQQQQDAQALSDQVDAMNDYLSGLSAEVQQLMAQAQSETEAAREAQYQAYLAQQAQEQEQQAASAATGEASGGGQQAGEGSTATEQAGVQEPSGTSASSGAYSGGSGGGTGNHASSVVDVAYGCIGVPYVWGGTSMSGFDCSGLAQYCYAACGYSIARDTYGQIAQIQSLGNWKTSMSDLQPGDLAFPHSGHVGIYCGGGMWIHAPAPGRSVEYTSVYAFMGGGSPI